MGSERPKCEIKTEVTIFCPLCGQTLKVPMHKVVNGDKIKCLHCQGEFSTVP
jgi:hypothetical protein